MLLIVCVLLIVWLLVSHWKTQRSLRWWQSRQLLQQSEAAELIRDGVLQEVFTLRRTLEFSLLNPDQPNPEVNQKLLTTFERFHHDLKDLSDRLSPAYVDDSLPLAIQHTLGTWQTICPTTQLAVELPPDWPDNKSEHSRMVLIALNELLRIALNPNSSNPSLTKPYVLLHLKHQHQTCELTVQIKELDPNSKILISEELNHLKQAFQILMPGDCGIKQFQQSIYCEFSWKS